MSLQWKLSQEVPFDTAAIGRAVLPEDNMYRQIGDHSGVLWPDQDQFAPMYCETGRGAIAPLLMSWVTVFQMLEKVPDRVAAEMVATRIDWKYALHLPLTYPGFHFTDLYAFRMRLLEHEQERLIFEQILEKLKEAGLIKRRGKMRTDSTHVLAQVQRLSQLELVTESLRVALRTTVQVAASWAEQTLPATLLGAYNERVHAYHLSKDTVEERLIEAGQDGFWFLAQVDRSAPDEVCELPEVATLRTVLAQQFPEGPNAPPARRPTGRDVIETPHEVEARWGRKRDKLWLGYKAQVTETCDEGRPRLITDLEVTEATDNDNVELSAIQDRLAAQETLPGEQQVDKGYVSGENLAKSAEKGIELVGIPSADATSPEGFRQADFHIDRANQQAICPAGETSAVWSPCAPRDGKPPAIEIRFAAKICQQCPFFGRCTTSRQGRSLTLNPYYNLLAAQRVLAKLKEYLERLYLRKGIEATVSELTRGHGLRRARYRAKGKLRLQGYFTAVAVNLKRLMRWLSGRANDKNMTIDAVLAEIAASEASQSAYMPTI